MFFTWVEQAYPQLLSPGQNWQLSSQKEPAKNLSQQNEAQQTTTEGHIDMNVTVFHMCNIHTLGK